MGSNGVAVNSADGSCWAFGNYNGVRHLAVDGRQLSSISMGARIPYSVSVNPTDGSFWVAAYETDGGPAAVTHYTVQGPAADFSAAPTTGSVPLNVQFADASLGSPTSWN
jgi:PKD repeat protein